MNFFIVSVESEVALSFINELSSWDESHVDENLVNSVQISTSAVAKIIRAYDHILYKNEKIVSLLKQYSEDFSSGEWKCWISLSGCT